jgi:AAT family amino acid transporter/GABA permease
MLFYVGSILMIVSVVPWNLIKPGHSPFTDALAVMRVPWATNIMSAIILTAVLSCLNSSFYIASRVLFVLAERGDAPRWLVKTNARLVPARSVLLASAAGFAGVLAAVVSPGVVFAFLVNASGALILFVYVAIAVSQVRLRRLAQQQGAAPPALPMWWFPWLSYLAIAAMTAVLVAMAFTPAMASQFWISVLSVAVALCAYLVVRQRRLRRASMP